MANEAYDIESHGDKKVLLAYEEAIGFMCGTQVLDKDGVSAAVKAVELMNFLSKEKNRTLWQKLNEIYDEYGYHCNRTVYFIISDPKATDKIFHRLRFFDQEIPNTVSKILSH